MAQFEAIESGSAEWGYWGFRPDSYSTWTNHSNRLIPIYVFGGDLDKYIGEHSAYRSAERLNAIFGYVPEETLNPDASYMDQTDVFRLQQEAIANRRKKHIILMVFDGMDWQTTWAAANYRNRSIKYREGRGTGLAFQDYQGAPTDFGFFVTSALSGKFEVDVDHQAVSNHENRQSGGYSSQRGGTAPWSEAADPRYLIAQSSALKHLVTDSASSATSMCSGIKTYNSAINVDLDGQEVQPLARQLQRDGFRVGVVTSVPISHATPAAAYANNVDRDDYQDLTRDMLGLPSIYHADTPLPGVDVLIGGGWGEKSEDDFKKQGKDFEPGNRYLADSDLEKVDAKHGGRYRVAIRESGVPGGAALKEAAELAARDGQRLFGYFGVGGGHLPYQTADGQFDPTRGASTAERYSPEDILENPTLADMSEAALTVLSSDNDRGFWLMIEAGDVDWANHNNNIDDSIGAVFSGEAAFQAVVEWVERHSNWDETLLIVTADHGHFFHLRHPEAIGTWNVR